MREGDLSVALTTLILFLEIKIQAYLKERYIITKFCKGTKILYKIIFSTNE